MRRFRVLLVLLLLSGAVPVAARAALVIEGDPDWDCLTMGNGVCGDEVESLVEGDAAWDCSTMGNRVCGEGETQSLAVSNSAATIAPPYSHHNLNASCGEYLLDTCRASAEADPATGAASLEAAAEGVSTHCPPTRAICMYDSRATAEMFADHVIIESVPSILYTATVNVTELELVGGKILGHDGKAIAEVFLSVEHLNDGSAVCLRRGFENIYRRQVRGFDELREENAVVTLSATLECKDRTGAQGVPVDVPPGTIRLEIRYGIAATARAERQSRYVGLTRASLDVAGTLLEAEVV